MRQIPSESYDYSKIRTNVHILSKVKSSTTRHRVMQKKIGLEEIIKMIKDKDVVLVSYNSWQENHFVSDFVKEIASKSKLKHITHSSLQIDLEMIKKYRDNVGTGFQYIISIGGGGVIDLAKILRSLNNIDFEKKKITDFDSEIIHIAIPTTVGSGSEATYFATYYGSHKESYTHKHNLPKFYCHEPAFIKSLNKDALYHSVLDGMTQAIESIFSRESDSKSIEYSRLSIKGYIESKILTSQNYDSQKLQQASFNAGKAINIAKTNIAHAISYHLTQHHNVPHGYAVFLSLEGLLKLIEDQSLLSKRVAEKKGTLLKLFKTNNLNEIIPLFKYIQNEIGLKEINQHITEIDFLKYFALAKKSSRGSNLDIDLEAISQEKILEYFYD